MSHPAPPVIPAGEAGAFQTGRVATIAAAHAVHDTFTAFLPPLLPRFIERFALSNTKAGLLAALTQIPSLLQPVIGHLADRTSLRLLVVLGPGVSATFMSVLGWAPGYAVLALLLTAAGFSVAAFHAVAPVAVGRLSGRSLGKGMGFWMVGGELGRMVGPLVVVSALAFLTLEGLAWLMVLGWAASAVLHLQLRRVAMHSGEGSPIVPWRTALRGMRRTMGLLAALVAARALLLSAAMVYLPLFLTEQGTSLWMAGASLSVLEAAGMAGALAGGWLSDRLGRRTLLFAGHLLAPAAAVLLVVSDGWLRVPFLLALGVTVLSIQPVNLALVQESFPESRALANGVYLSLNFGLGAVAAVLFGALGDAFGLATGFVVAALVMLGGLPLVWLLPESNGPVREAGPPAQR